jgi:5-hydroxyisourate hydrolase-like protein (transthyretin family)
MSILGIGLLLLQVQLATASGIVTKPGGNEPLPKATIILAPVAPGQNARLLRSAVTEEDGRFTVRDIEPGDYRLTVQTERYGHVAYGQRKPGGPGTILTITAGQRLSDLRVSMIPTGAITGRITGRDGEPLVYTTVQALKYAYRDGRKTLTVAQTATTDDRGEYRLFWLPPGSYFVAAAKDQTIVSRRTLAEPLAPGISSYLTSESLAVAQAFQLLEVVQGQAFHTANTTVRILEDGTVQEEAWVPVYYPGAAEPRLATAIGLAAGTTRSGIDIIIGPARVQKVRGRVIGFAPGSTPTVTLVPLNAAGFRNPSAGRGASNIDGSFAFTGVLPGDYVVVARDVRAGVVGPPLPIHVGDGDVENITVSVGQPLSLTGRVLVEGVVNPLPRIFVSLRPNNLPGLAPINTQADAVTGSFVLNNLVPGDYQIQISDGAIPAGDKPLFMKSARLGLTDVTDSMPISANTADRLEIVLTADPGAAEGVAIGSGGIPAPNATVVLVPNVARRRPDLYKSVVTGTDGRFRFQDLAPGDYKLFAWDDVETGAWQDPDFMRAYESKGLLVRIAEKGKEDVQLNVIYNP